MPEGTNSVRAFKCSLQWKRKLAGACAAAVLFCAQRADAQGAAAAAALSTEADKLMAEGRAEEACPKLKESDRLVPKLSTRYRLASCYEKTKRPATAWALYEEIAGAAQAAADDPARRARRSDYEKLANAARGRATELKANLPMLTITVPDTLRSVAGIEIKLDNKKIGEVLWNQAIPVDLIEHLIVVSAPGKKTWEERRQIDSMGQAIEVIVPELADEKAKPKPPPDDEGMPWQRKAAIGLGIGGVLGLGAGAVGGFLAISSHQDAVNACPDRVCADAAKKSEALAAEDKAGGYATLSNVGLIGGGALAGAAVVFWLIAPSKKAAPAEEGRLLWFPLIQAGAAAGVVRGTF